MKSILLFIALCLFSLPVFAQVKPKPIPPGTCETKFNYTLVEASYLSVSGVGTLQEFQTVGNLTEVVFTVCGPVTYGYNSAITDNAHDYGNTLLFLRLNGNLFELEQDCTGNINKNKVDIACQRARKPLPPPIEIAN